MAFSVRTINPDRTGLYGVNPFKALVIYDGQLIAGGWFSEPNGTALYRKLGWTKLPTARKRCLTVMYAHDHL